MDKFFKNYTNPFDLYYDIIKKKTQDLAIEIKSKYKKLIFLIPILKYIHLNPQIIIIGFSVFGFFFANVVIDLVFVLLLLDSIILSLLVLHSIALKEKSRRLSKNVLGLFLLYFNPLGSIVTMVIACFLYTNYSKFTSKLIIKLLENIILFCLTNIPFIGLLYPESKFIKQDDTIDSTDDSTNNENTLYDESSSS